MAITVGNDVIRPLLLEMIGALLARPPNVDLLEIGIMFEDAKRGGHHVLIQVFVAFC